MTGRDASFRWRRRSLVLAAKLGVIASRTTVVSLLLAVPLSACTNDDAASYPPSASPTSPLPGTEIPTTPTSARSDIQPPPSLMAYMSKDGFLEIPRWDDRPLAESVKQEYPWTNPRWAPFNRCLVENGAGRADLTDEGARLTQHDIDGILAELNQAGPFLRSERSGPVIETTEEVEAFASCAVFLELDNTSLQQHLSPGDPRDEAPDVPAELRGGHNHG
jgi:hypothetical protein